MDRASTPTTAMVKALSGATQRERGTICPIRGVHAAAEDALINAMDRRGYIVWNGTPGQSTPFISDAGRAALNPSPADRLVAEAAKSRETEAWISRQIMAGQRPSQILAALDRKPGIGGDGVAGLTFACALVFVSTFCILGWALPS